MDSPRGIISLASDYADGAQNPSDPREIQRERFRRMEALIEAAELAPETIEDLWQGVRMTKADMRFIANGIRKTLAALRESLKP